MAGNRCTSSNSLRFLPVDRIAFAISTAGLLEFARARLGFHQSLANVRHNACFLFENITQCRSILGMLRFVPAASGNDQKSVDYALFIFMTHLTFAAVCATVKPVAVKHQRCIFFSAAVIWKQQPPRRASAGLFLHDAPESAQMPAALAPDGA